jgi:phage tail sheath protein FI
VVSVINASSTYIRVADQNSASVAPDDRPEVDGLKALSGGVNGSTPTRTQYSDSLNSFDPIQNPLVFNVPAAAYIYAPSGNTTDRTLAVNVQGDLINYAQLRGDAFAIVDVPRGLTVDEAQTFITDVVTAAPDSDGGVAAAYFPWTLIPDSLRASGGATRLQAPGAAMAGQFLATDASRGVFKTPAGLTNSLANVVATERLLTNAELDDLNDNPRPINAIRQIPGAGIVVMGGRTLRNTSNERYINIQRSLIYIKKELENRSQFALFENNDPGLWKRLNTALSSFLLSYWQQGGLRGTSASQAFYVKVDSSTTSFSDIQNGRVNLEVGVALQYPAEFIVIKLSQLTGSASA